MKYADEFRHTETITATGATTYSAWFDITWANELYSFLTYAEAETGNSETVDVTLEHYVPYATATATTTLTHTQCAAATNETKVASWIPAGDAAQGAANVLGMRVRWKFISGGTFAASQIITMTMVLYAKRN